MGEPLLNRQGPADDYLSSDEIIAALDALSPDDKLKLEAIEAIRRRGTGLQRKELMHEAMCRALLGERNCPRSVPFMAFMAQTMRSIASHERERRRRLHSLEEGERAVDPARGVSADALPATPEDILMAKQEAAAVQAIYSCFDDDSEAQLVLMGLEDGLRGAALREAAGLDQGQLDYAIRRIRTRMRKEYPQGWIT